MIGTFGLHQNIQQPTCGKNLLDVIVSDSTTAVSDIIADDAGRVSDHQLIIAKVAIGSATRCGVAMTSINLQKVDPAAFEPAIRSSAGPPTDSSRSLGGG
jgi:hypothetical protein